MHSILIVDDEPELLDITKLFLEKNAHVRVKTALSADEGLRKLDGAAFDAVISDYEMPGMDGIEFLKAVRQRWQNLPFIIFTGRGREAVAIEALNEGADFYLQKGGHPSSQFAELVNMVKRSIQLKKTQDTLRESENRYRTLYEDNPSMYFTVDPSGTVLSVNDYGCRHLGYTAQELVGQSVLRVFYEEDKDAAVQSVTQCVENPGQVFDWELRKVRRDGSMLWVKETARALRQTDGNAVVLIVCEDITERKLAEEALRESEEKFREIFDKVNDAIHIVEMNKNGFPGKFIDINEAACRMLQYDREKLLRHTPLELTTDYYDPPLEQIRGEIRAHGHAIFETEYKRKDGTIVPVEVNVHNTVFQGKSVGIAIVRDITERKKAEAALRESEAKYRTIIENLQGMFYRTDRDGNLTMISPHGVKLAGYNSEEEMIGLNIARDIYQDPEERKRFLDELIKRGSVDNYPLVLKDRHGTPHIVTASSHFYYDDQGNVLGVEGILHDITEQKKTEEALAFMNKKLNLMSSITRHDILNQLTALSGSIQLASVHAKEPKAMEYLDYAEKTIGTIKRQIAFTTEYESIGVLAPVWQPLSDTVRSAVSQLHTTGVAIDVADNPVEIYADPLLEKVFLNLIHNALKHGGRVTRISISLNENDRGLVISVADNGTGILPENKNHLFEPGFGKHKGLGLFLAKEILVMTGMTIDETGESGKGARFEIVVPRGGYRFIETKSR